MAEAADRWLAGIVDESQDDRKDALMRGLERSVWARKWRPPLPSQKMIRSADGRGSPCSRMRNRPITGTFCNVLPRH
jgi:hypothetical protein